MGNPPPTVQPKSIALRLVTGLVRFYRFALSPLKPPCCRFSPTCSAYALDAFHHHGLLRGAGLTLRRLLKCHPFYRGASWDPVPPAPPPGNRPHG